MFLLMAYGGYHGDYVDFGCSSMLFLFSFLVDGSASWDSGGFLGAATQYLSQMNGLELPGVCACSAGAHPLHHSGNGRGGRVFVRRIPTPMPMRKCAASSLHHPQKR